MDYDNDLEEEALELLFGSHYEIHNKLNNCKKCGAGLAIQHVSDFESLTMTEISECVACGYERRKKVNPIN